VTAVKFRISRYIWIVGTLALTVGAFAAAGDVWGRTDDQRSSIPPQGRSSADGQRPSPRPGSPGGLPGLPPSGSEWWKDPEVKKRIRLTETQSAKIDQIWRVREREYGPYSAEFDRQWQEMERMAAERTASVEEFALQVSRTQALRTKLQESRYVMLYRISKELTPDQLTKLQELERERRSQGRGRGGPR
jgi:Spy/CpxP family protein refolding chaperone